MDERQYLKCNAAETCLVPLPVRLARQLLRQVTVEQLTSHRKSLVPVRDDQRCPRLPDLGAQPVTSSATARRTRAALGARAAVDEEARQHVGQPHLLGPETQWTQDVLVHDPPERAVEPANRLSRPQLSCHPTSARHCRTRSF